MSIATQQVRVGSREFKLTKLPAMRGANLFNRLSSIVAPAMAKAVGSGGAVNIAAVLRAPLAGIGDGVQTLFAKLNEAEQEYILRELFTDASVKLDAGKWAPLMDIFDDIFAGQIEQIFQLAGEALKLNYKSFWNALAAAISAALDPAAEEVVPEP